MKLLFMSIVFFTNSFILVMGKLFGLISISWFWTLFPLWIYPALLTLVVFVCLVKCLFKQDEI